MFYLLIIITGIISFVRLPIEFLPEVGYPQLTVITIYENSSPQEVETLISQPIEEVVSTLKGVRKVSSISRNDVSIVTIKFNWGTEMSYASLSLREKMDNIRYSLPEEAERPNIAHLDPSEEPVMYIALTSNKTDDIIQIQNIAENLIKRRLQQLEGVASADIIGDMEEEIQIILAEDKINSLGLSLDQIKNQIYYSNFNIAGGTIKEGHYRYNLKIVGEFQSIQDIEKTPVSYGKDGSIILLKDVAEIKFGYKEEKSITRLNSHRSLGVLIRKEANSNTVKVCSTLRKSLEQLRKEYPAIRFEIPVDQSVFIRESIKSVLEAIIIGGLLAFLVLFFFLRDLKSPFNISFVIPIAILMTFILMYFNKITLNIISLSGLALGVGMLVDNSIVVSENIFRHRSKGESWKRAAFIGTKEVGMPITASTLTTLAVFLPILYVKGIASTLFREQALTVSFSLLSSLLVSLTMLPLLASLRERKQKNKTIKQHRKFTKAIIKTIKIIFSPLLFLKKILKMIFNNIRKFLYSILEWFHHKYEIFAELYFKLLNYSLTHRTLSILIFIFLFLSSLGILSTLDREFFPDFEQSSFTILLKSDAGTPLEKTDQIVSMVEEYLKNDSRIENFFTSVGKSTEDKLSYYLEKTSSENLAEIKINLKPKNKTADVIEDFRKLLKQIPAAISFQKGENILVSLLEFEEPGLSVVIKGEDLEKMKLKALEIKKQINSDPVFKNIRTDFETEAPMIRLEVNRENAALYDIPINQISRFIRTNISGEKISDFRQFDNKIDITLKMNKDMNLTQLLDQHLNWQNKKIPLRTLVNEKYVRTFEEIKRADQYRKFTISTSYKGKLKDALLKLEKIIEKTPSEDKKINLSVEGINIEISHSLRSLMYALLFAIVLVYMILASQFESLKLPFIVMFVVPMGVIGVSFALIISGTSISVMSTLGMIVLSGIIVNDAILLIDYVNRLRKEGQGVFEAVKAGAQTRLRPILITTFTTVLGLLPLAIGIGSGAELQSAMAIAVIGGMLASTFLTLILIPVLYTFFEK